MSCITGLSFPAHPEKWKREAHQLFLSKAFQRARKVQQCFLRTVLRARKDNTRLDNTATRESFKSKAAMQMQPTTAAEFYTRLLESILTASSPWRSKRFIHRQMLRVVIELICPTNKHVVNCNLFSVSPSIYYQKIKIECSISEILSCVILLKCFP